MESKKKRNHEWEQVHGPDLQKGPSERAKLNDSILLRPDFIAACEKCELTRPRRQAGKFRRKKGLVYNFLRG